MWNIMPLDVGLCTLGKNHVLGDDYSDDDRIPFALYSYLVVGWGIRKVLVDLGPKTIGYTNEMFRRYGFFRVAPSQPDDIVQRYGNTLDWLSRLGLSPAEITDIVFTHLHADHHGMDDGRGGGMCEDFPYARFHVSRIGWNYNLSKRCDGHWNSYLDWGFGDFLLRMDEEGRVNFTDDEEIAPGIRTVYLGGHSVCSQAVRIEVRVHDSVQKLFLYRISKTMLSQKHAATRLEYIFSSCHPCAK